MIVGWIWSAVVALVGLIIIAFLVGFLWEVIKAFFITDRANKEIADKNKTNNAGRKKDT